MGPPHAPQVACPELPPSPPPLPFATWRWLKGMAIRSNSHTSFHISEQVGNLVGQKDWHGLFVTVLLSLLW